MRTRTATAFAATLCTITLLAGCGNDAPEAGEEPTTPAPASETATEEPSEESTPEESPEESSSAPAEEVVITISDFEYSDPGPVAPGTEITVENTDAEAHTVTADGKGGFDITIAPGKTETLTAPDAPGEYPYLCTFHSGMTGTLVVE